MQEKRKITKGQIIITILTIIGSLFGATITAWSTTNSKTIEIDKKAEIIKTTEDLHYKEVEKRLSKIEEKIDFLIEKKLK